MEGGSSAKSYAGVVRSSDANNGGKKESVDGGWRVVGKNAGVGLNSDSLVASGVTKPSVPSSTIVPQVVAEESVTVGGAAAFSGPAALSGPDSVMTGGPVAAVDQQEGGSVGKDGVHVGCEVMGGGQHLGAHGDVQEKHNNLMCGLGKEVDPSIMCEGKASGEQLSCGTPGRDGEDLFMMNSANASGIDKDQDLGSTSSKTIVSTEENGSRVKDGGHKKRGRPLGSGKTKVKVGVGGKVSQMKTSGEKCVKLRRKIGFDSSFVEEAQGFYGGIWVLWKSKDVKVDVLNFSSSCIGFCPVELKNVVLVFPGSNPSSKSVVVVTIILLEAVRQNLRFLIREQELN
ncbi:hypothetical protein K1719_043263 [Acacia pycnantha]|nr:hypothetical protein K1719_043263 [Acacia pycnantha]